MASDNPVAIMIAGPNGAGKTTAASKLFQEMLHDVEFVNADVIAQGLSS
jgi:predicted ABC-type ATPase